MMRLALLTLCLLLLPQGASAHKASDSYLTVRHGDDGLALRWDIALRDLDHAIGLDADGDGAVTWGELRAGHARVEAYSLARLGISGDGQACATGPVGHRVDRHSDGTYAVMEFAIACPTAPATLALDYRLFFDLDAQHRGLVSVDGGDVRVVGPDATKAVFALQAGASAGFGAFFLEGVHHLVGGADHMLFLLVVMLPIAFGSTFAARERRVGAALSETAKILTAFTIAHGLTLSAAVLDVVRLPSTPVEVMIALSIALAAIDNIRPFLGERRWLVAGGFGLIHGFGFAAVLGPLELSPAGLAVALLGFNLGIEAAQLAIALVILALGRVLARGAVRLAPAVRLCGSAAACVLAGMWTVDRAFDLALMPF